VTKSIVMVYIILSIDINDKNDASSGAMVANSN
jgi:hypothetical protein